MLMPGLRNTHVLHPSFERHHRPVSAGAMPAECRIDRPSSAAQWDDTAGRDVYPDPERIYGPDVCRVYKGAPAPGVVATAGDRAVTLSDYGVVIPTCTAQVQVGDIVTITVCTGDPQLVGRRLRVRDVMRGSTTWERVLACELQPLTSR